MSDNRRAQDSAVRARNQLGVFFLALSVPLAAGLAFAAVDAHGEFLRHSALWWASFAIGMGAIGMSFAALPWAREKVYDLAPGDPVGDAVKGIAVLIGFTVAFGALDAGVVPLLVALKLRGSPGRALAHVVAPAVVVCGLHLGLKGKRAGLPAVLLLAIFWNALLVEWCLAAGGFRPFATN